MPKQNSHILNSIIKFQERGYDYDFRLSLPGCLICLQDATSYELSEMSIQVVDRILDTSTKIYFYLHKVDSYNGHKGLLLSPIMIPDKSKYR